MPRPPKGGSRTTVNRPRLRRFDQKIIEAFSQIPFLSAAPPKRHVLAQSQNFTEVMALGTKKELLFLNNSEPKNGKHRNDLERYLRDKVEAIYNVPMHKLYYIIYGSFSNGIARFAMVSFYHEPPPPPPQQTVVPPERAVPQLIDLVNADDKEKKSLEQNGS